MTEKRKPGRPRKIRPEEVDAQAQGAGVGEASERPHPVSELGQDVCREVAEYQNGGLAVTCSPAIRPSPMAGGSENISRSELAALHAEAWDAFDLDRPTGKTDSLGRIWAFDVEIKGGVKTVDLSVRRVGGLKHGTKIEVPVLDFQGARPVVEQIVNRLNGELA